MNEQFLVLGNTLYRESGGDQGHKNQDSYYMTGSGSSLKTGDPNELYGSLEPRGSWEHFHESTGSTMGQDYQIKRDCRGNRVNCNKTRLARLHNRISRSSSGYHNKVKYISLTAPLREFFPDQLLGQACQLFQKVQPRLTGKDTDFSCFLACVEFLLIDQGMAIQESALNEINSQLDLDISKKSIFKHRIAVKKGCVELYGRKEAFRRFHRRGGTIVGNRIGELLIDLPIDPDIKSKIRTSCKNLITALADSYIPKQYTSHAHALMKIACEDLDLVDKSNWDQFLQVEETMKKSVYSIAYKLRRRLNDLETRLEATEGRLREDVATPLTSVRGEREQTECIIVDDGCLLVEDFILPEKQSINSENCKLSRQALHLRLLALNIAVIQLQLVSDSKIADKNHLIDGSRPVRDAASGFAATSGLHRAKIPSQSFQDKERITKVMECIKMTMMTQKTHFCRINACETCEDNNTRCST